MSIFKYTLEDKQLASKQHEFILYDGTLTSVRSLAKKYTNFEFSLITIVDNPRQIYSYDELANQYITTSEKFNSSTLLEYTSPFDFISQIQSKKNLYAIRRHDYPSNVFDNNLTTSEDISWMSLDELNYQGFELVK